MGKAKGPYNADFPVDTCVRIADRSVLDNFLATYRLHHPLVAEQLSVAGTIARVRDVGYYHGADELYWLQDIPGVWHEHLLQAATTEEAANVPPLRKPGHPTRRGWAMVVGIVTASATGYGLYLILLFVGGLTGVLAMCATAPDWWADTFFVLLFAFPAVGGVLAGLFTGRRFMRRA